VAIAINEAWAYAVVGIWALIWLASLAQLALRIRRAR
jgi:hypothetical protein